MGFIQKATVVAAVVMAATVQLAYADDAGLVQNDVFSITLPAGFAPFAKQSQSATDPAGKKIETTNWVSKSPTGEAVVVTMSQMPGKILEPEKLISSTRDSLLKTLKATLESEEKKDGDLPAARLLFRSNAAVFRSRLIVDGDRFLQILYVGHTAEQRSVPAVGQMFDSFRIEKPHTEHAMATPAPAPAKAP